VYSNGFNNQHTTTINGNGLPDNNDMIRLAETIGIHKKTAQNIIDEITEKTKIVIQETGA